MRATLVLLGLIVALFADSRPPAAPDAGREAFVGLGCGECHVAPALGDVGRPKGTRRAGPVLDGSQPWRSREWQLAHLHDPRSVSPDSTMPSYAHLFEPDPNAKKVAGFVQDVGGDDGIVTEEECPSWGFPRSWSHFLALYDRGDGVISLADVAPRPTARVEALLDLLESWESADAPEFERAPAPVEGSVDRGRELHQRYCAGCHGESGNGSGPAARFFRNHPPRNFLRGEYKFRSTFVGASPTDRDLFESIRNGVGASMPAWRQLSDRQVWDLVAWLKSLSPMDEEPPVDMGESRVPFDAESVSLGERIYREFKCDSCHGAEGKGDGPAADETRGSLGEINRPADYTRGVKHLKTGADPGRIVRTFLTGMQGTPMPSFASSFAACESAPPDHAPWHLAHYILHQAGVRR
jgi:mono/diheme cytochrome c family protein